MSEIGRLIDDMEKAGERLKKLAEDMEMSADGSCWAGPVMEIQRDIQEALEDLS